MAHLGKSGLHQNGFYNAFQFSVSILAVASGGLAKGMQNPTCFIAGTPVLTANGLVAIENIKAGDKVISTASDTGVTEEKTVLEVFRRSTTELVHLTICGEKITTTHEHPFFVVGKGFVNAGERRICDILQDSNQNRLTIDDISFETTENPTAVYNFKVEDYHTYYVGRQSLLVHNADCGGSYKDVYKQNKEYNKTQPDRAQKLHAHHMPADSASNLPTDSGPCISMTAEDHSLTASYDKAPGSTQYRATQQQLVSEGRFTDAFNMDVADIQSKFPGKYDNAIAQAREYMNSILGG